MNFMFNNSISFSNDGSMVIKNGSQTIKMGRGGMVIENNGGQNVIMNSNGIQVINQQTHYTNYGGQNYRVQTNFSTNQHNYGNGAYEDESSGGVSSHNSSYDDSAYWHDEEDQGQGYNYQNYQGNANGNVGWQVHHHVNFQGPSMYYYTSSQGSQTQQEQQQYQEQPPKKKGLSKSQLNQLPVSTYNIKSSKVKPTKGKTTKSLNESSVIESCPICIVDYCSGDKLKTLPCMHRFHRDCIDKWLGMKSDCPICKYDLLE